MKYLENPEKFPVAEIVKPLESKSKGVIQSIDVRKLGIAILSLGGGRIKVSDQINPKVGLSGLARVGKKVDQGEPLAVIHADSQDEWQEAANTIADAISVEDGPLKVADTLILDRI